MHSKILGTTPRTSDGFIWNDRFAPYWIVFATFFAAMAFALYTRLAWDDWYITFRASKNLALGNGLTFTPGERIHSFTSPLGTLIPAFLSAATGNTSDDAVLWLFRIVNSISLGFAAVLLWFFGKRAQMTKLALFVLVAVAVLESKVLANTIDGMESAILLLFLALNLYALTLNATFRSALLLGVAWAGLMWTRPDGFVYVIGPCAGFLIFRPFAPDDSHPWPDRWSLLKHWLVAGAIGAVLYAPWVFWAWRYYGSPVPHTIIAKSLSKSSSLFANGISGFASTTYVAMRNLVLARSDSLPATFVPPYAALFRGWPWPVFALSHWLTWACAIIWFIPVPRIGRLARAISLAVFISLFYFGVGMEYAFPWYYPPVTLLCAVVIAQFFDAIFRYLRANGDPSKESRFGRFGPAVEITLAALPVLFVGSISIAAAIQLRSFQSLIYDANYKQIGLFLREHAASPRDTVFLEPLGYIGFFSNLKMYDYPGLSSDEMLAARKVFPVADLGSRTVFADLIPHMHPDWLALRPREIEKIQTRNPTVLTTMYHVVRTFDVTPEVEQLHVPGKPWFQFDSGFVLYHRT